MANSLADKYPLLPEFSVDQSREFSDEPLYSPEGDFLMVLLEDTPFYSERIDHLLTVFRSTESKEIIGCNIKGFSAIAENVVNFIGIADGDGVGLALFLLNAAGVNPPGIYTYDLAPKVRNVKLSASLLSRISMASKSHQQHAIAG